MYKIGFRSEINEHDLEAAKQAGIEVIEIMQMDSTRARQDQVAALLTEYDIKPSAMGIYPQRGLDELKADVDFASDIGCPVYFGHVEWLGPNDTDRIKQFGDMWTEAVRYGEDKGVKIAMHSCGLDPVSWDIMFETVPGLYLKYDPSFSVQQGRDYRAEILKYGERIVHIHAKDEMRIATVNGDEFRYAPAGMGDINWGSVIALLYEIGYAGDIAIEVHSPYWFSEKAFVHGLTLAKRHLEQFMV